jgi:GDP-4-dehydro-6-deoxy-D-mannose reductase
MLVTGASGFAGTHLARRLRELGHDVVTAASSGDVAIRLDVRDRDAVHAAFVSAAPQGVFHLAGLAYVPIADAQAGDADAVNRGGTANVLDAAREVGARTLVVSSGAVYGRLGEGELPAREDTQLRPAGAYALSKAAAEEECRRRAARQEVVIVRPFNHTGPGQSREYVCSDFAAQIAECEAGKRPPRIEVGDLRSERDFSDVRDIVDAYVRAFESGEPGEVYNACSGHPTSAGRILDILVASSSVAVEVVVGRDRLRSGEVSRLYGSSAKLTRATGWRPARSLEQTLTELLADWRRRTREVGEEP